MGPASNEIYFDRIAIDVDPGDRLKAACKLLRGLKHTHRLRTFTHLNLITQLALE
jgi:hypothetical protein